MTNLRVMIAADIGLFDHPPYVTITHGMRGSFCVLLSWQPDSRFPDRGFYEPWITGDGSYLSSADPRLIAEARFMAECEGVEFRP